MNPDPGVPAPPPRRSRRRRMALKLIGFFGSLALGCLLSEVIVLARFGEQPKFPRRVVGAPWGLRYNEPNARYRHKSADVEVQFRINSQGMRAERDYALPKPKGVKRIISLGDSYTMGYEVPREQCFSSVLEDRLTARGVPVEVLNCGVSGYSNAEECLYLEKELIRYEPDLVVVSFYWNDLDDNIRSGLFALEGDRLKQLADRYVPGGGMADFLNENWFFSLASERSNAFCFLKEKATLMMKRRMVEENTQAIAAAPAARKEPDSKQSYKDRLALAIFERIYAFLAARGIPLIVQSIPLRCADDQLAEAFPSGFDFSRRGVWFLPAKPYLDPLVGKETLYYRRSHWHWTPIAHRLSGEHLAELIQREGLLR